MPNGPIGRLSLEVDPAKDAQREEARRRVAAAIDRLPSREREVLVLKEYEEMK